MSNRKPEQIKDGGSAFPRSGVFHTEHYEDGMSLRDWFATFAPMPSEEHIERAHQFDLSANPHNEPHKPNRRTVEEIVAEFKFRHADAMLKQRGNE